MRALTGPGPQDPGPEDPGPQDQGRLIWAASGLGVMATLVAGAALLIAPAPAGSNNNAFAQPQSAQVQGMTAQAVPAQAAITATRTISVPQPVTSVTVLSYGAPVEITGGPVSRVQVSETIGYNSTPPSVTESLAGGHLLLADPQCSVPRSSPASCSVSFTVIVPAGVRVAVVTGGGPAELTFDVAPDSVSVSTGGGSATVNVAGGPYALTADSGGGPEVIAIATDPSAARSITISTDGGPLQVGP